MGQMHSLQGMQQSLMQNMSPPGSMVGLPPAQSNLLVQPGTPPASAAMPMMQGLASAQSMVAQPGMPGQTGLPQQGSMLMQPQQSFMPQTQPFYGQQPASSPH